MVLTFSDAEEHIINKICAVVECEQTMEHIKNPVPSILTFPNLEIHLYEQIVYHNQIPIHLSHNEFFTLLYLARHPGWVFSREQIYEAVWKENGDGGAAVVNVISQIRKKIGDRYIKTVIGSGYKFEV